MFETFAKGALNYPVYVDFWKNPILMFQCPNKSSGLKEMTNLALSQNLPIPGEQGFPMNALFKAPTNKSEEGCYCNGLL